MLRGCGWMDITDECRGKNKMKFLEEVFVPSFIRPKYRRERGHFMVRRIRRKSSHILEEEEKR